MKSTNPFHGQLTQSPVQEGSEYQVTFFFFFLQIKGVRKTLSTDSNTWQTDLNLKNIKE